MNIKNGILFILSLYLIHSTEAKEVGGILLEKGTKKPIEGASLFLKSSRLKSITDEKGVFKFSNLPDSLTFDQLIITAFGYLKEEQLLQLSENAIYTLQKESYFDEENTYVTTITDKELKRDDSKKTISAKKAVSLPGSGGDVLRGVQNLPGIARDVGLSSRIIIQGSSPQDTKYRIDGHEVPIIFHFGGLSSIIQSEALDHIDYLSAGFDSSSGRAQGGLIDATTKTPDSDRTKGFVFVDLVNSGAAIETKAGENGSLYIGGRKSYIGSVLKAAAKKSDSFNLTAAPTYEDLSIVYAKKLNTKDQFKLLTIGSRDTLEFVLSKASDNDSSLRGKFYNQTAMFRVIPEWTLYTENDSKISFSAGFGEDFIKFILNDDFFNLRNKSVSLRSEYETKLSSYWDGIFGLDHRLNSTSIDLRLPAFYTKGDVANPLNNSEFTDLSLKNISSNFFGFYTKAIYSGIPKWTLKPGVRFDYFQPTKDFFIEPRIAARRALNESTDLKFSSGLYAQSPTAQEFSKEAGNPNLNSPRSIHFTIGSEKRFFESNKDKAFTLSTNLYFKRLLQQVVQSSQFIVENGTYVAEKYNNGSSGKAYGLELMINGNLEPYTYSLSYTLSKSVRTEGGVTVPSSFDQPHNLNLIVGKNLSNNWKISSRFRFVSGTTLTPVTDSVYDADNSSYIPIRGSLFSERASPFWQLDVRLDKKWIYNTWTLSMYLDIQNILNHRNIENIQYSYNYKSREDVVGLPILPILGFKGEF